MRVVVLAAVFALAASAGAAFSQENAAGSARAGPPSAEDLRALADLLGKPGLRDRLREMSREASVPALTRPEAATAHGMVANWLDETRAFLRALAATIPELPARLDVARARLVGELRERGAFAVILPLAAFGALGAVVEALFWSGTATLRRRLIASPLDELEGRLKALGSRALYGVGIVGAFTLGSVGAFLAFDWPPLLQRIVLSYLLAFLAVRLTIVLGRIVLAPGAPRFRMVPLATPAARYWFVHSALLVGLFSAIKATYDLLPALAVDEAARTLVGLGLGFVLLVLTLVTIWRRPAPGGGTRHDVGRDGLSILLSVYLACLWLSTVTGATAPLLIGLVLMMFVLGNVGLHAAVRQLLRGPDATGEPTAPGSARPLAVVTLDRVVRITLLIIAAIVIVRILDLDATMLMANDRPAARFVRSLLNVAVILLLAELAWQVARAWIDRIVGEVGAASAAASDEEVRRRQRLRTLLPILRNVLLFVLVAVAALMALSAVGIEIGPLIAGAGVVGIAVGFGAQTLVKDVIAGMFFLLDDAFRVGEYIESGRIKGTVESFSLRSVKLRHHRGPLHTVPFGSLSTITNYSRDWVIDKMTLGLAYDTDLDRVKKIVKDIGLGLQNDPEFAPHILETLKMQGVDAFGDFAVQVRLKMMTRPDEQFVIRRRAYALIKQAFDREGIRFAYPTVTIAGGEDGARAAAAGGTLPRAV